jgi:hypothetical protein
MDRDADRKSCLPYLIPDPDDDMKRTFLIALLAASPLAAQPTLHNHSLFEIGAATPGGSYARTPNQQGRVYSDAASITPVFNSGQGAMQGMYASFHRVTYVGASTARFRGGFDLGTAVAYMPIDWATIYQTSTFAKNNGDFVGDLTIGPVVSYNPTGRLAFDASARLGYGMMGLSRMKVLDYQLPDSSRGIVEDANDAPASGRASAIGFRVRYGSFMAGWETHGNVGPRTRTYTVTKPNVGEPKDFNYIVGSKVPTTRFAFGFVF